MLSGKRFKKQLLLLLLQDKNTRKQKKKDYLIQAPKNQQSLMQIAMILRRAHCDLV